VDGTKTKGQTQYTKIKENVRKNLKYIIEKAKHNTKIKQLNKFNKSKSDK